MFLARHGDLGIRIPSKEVEHANFTSLVLSATRRMGREATNLFKGLASILAQKWDHPYSTTLC